MKTQHFRYILVLCCNITDGTNDLHNNKIDVER